MITGTRVQSALHYILLKLIHKRAAYDDNTKGAIGLTGCIILCYCVKQYKQEHIEFHLVQTHLLSDKSNGIFLRRLMIQPEKHYEIHVVLKKIELTNMCRKNKSKCLGIF